MADSESQQQLTGMLLGQFWPPVTVAGLKRVIVEQLTELERVRDTALLAYEHQVYPFDLLVDEVEDRHDPSRNPLFDVLVALAQEPLRTS